ncbi:NF-X1-type zinc finger protein NFXL1 [Canna indica]|uniref:NF-X1-type zinc finger protein NFXL1 n=1 Tax=Canna indica TaxID=4628 RepID=A0AAQ3QEH7_9LILI|nr:NF-X1-type zinc finger protein NFXL1 [Canna indica]
MRPTTAERSHQHQHPNHHRSDRRPAGPGAGASGSRPHQRQEWVPRGSAPAAAAAPILPTPPSVAEPGHRHRHRHTQVSRPSPPSAGERDSSLPQLVQEIQDKLVKGVVECMICYDMVRRSAAIWSCCSCYSIFHLHCIRKWARSPTSVDAPSSSADGGVAGSAGWRCPGCQSVQSVPSRELSYTCFCGGRRDPPNDLYLIPHSCGEPCRKPLDRTVGMPDNSASNVYDDSHCPHVCVLQCHPGPCPPCKAFAPRRSCPCGKKTIVRRCSDQKSPLTCGQQCNHFLSCGRHRCERICHTGSCSPCRVLITASCFCKKTTEVVLCGDLLVKGNVEAIGDGVFSCNSVCGRTLSCGNHFCNETCHPGSCGECEMLPDKINSCHCGKTKLNNERKSCLDPVPTCSEVCEKVLPCGIHTCKELCHEGDCPSCLVQVDQKCRCRSSIRTVECYKVTGEKEIFLCDKPCGKKKNCGRHRCSERCCPLSKPGGELLAGDWDPHLCPMPCGKRLRCGQHSCQLLCHSGYCPPCLETIFTDLTCACGKTSIPPPLPCGTPTPSCPHPCLVAQPCGHPASHTCHFGDCPPCSVPVVKECIGGHVLLRNIPCGSRDIRCNQLCGKTRQCGIHACARTCHPPPCDAPCASGSGAGVKSSCGQVCGAPRRDCKHTCNSPCHPSDPCPDVRCDVPVTISCSCDRITATVPCNAGGSSSGYHVDTVLEASILQKLPVPLLPVEANGKKIPLGQRKLTCDEECAKMERKRVLAEAFDITPPNLDALHFGENITPSDLLADLFRREPKWMIAVEERLKFLVLGKTKGGASGGLRVHVFCPMSKEKRDAIRQIAERWKLAVQAAGWEPKRFIVVHVTPKSRPPARILGSKAGVPVTSPQPPAFDPLVDMDPRLVVSMLDLPRDADISALVLRFGGECELVWLNDKNALAVFADPARAATALRRLDHGSVYQGAVVLSGPSVNNAWGMGPKDGGVAPKGSNPWKKALATESDSWGGDWSSSGADATPPAWRPIEAAPISASANPWNVLNSDATMSSISADLAADNSVVSGGEAGLTMKPETGGVISIGQGVAGGEVETKEVDDWEEAYE